MKRIIQFVLLCMMFVLALVPVNAESTGWSETEFEYDVTITAWDGTKSKPSDYDEDLFVLIYGRQSCGNTQNVIRQVQTLIDQGYSIKAAIMLIDDRNASQTPEELNADHPEMIVSDTYSANSSAYWTLQGRAGISGSILPSVYVMNSNRKVVFSACATDAIAMISSKIKELIEKEHPGFDPDIPWIPLSVTYHQSEARTMLEMINEFRTGDEAWAWNSDDSEKVWYENLTELTYDYDLEKAAMQRAAEIAVSFSHTRTDGSQCFTAYPDAFAYGASGENIAAGYTSAGSAFIAWREDDLPYYGQGHRRNMLGTSFRSVGIGCAEYNGRKYWVQEFSSLVINTNPVDYDEEPVEVKIPVTKKLCQLQLLFEDAGYNSNPEAKLAVGESIGFPSVSAKVVYDGSDFADLGEVTEYEISDPDVIQVENGRLVALKEGSSSVTWKTEYGSLTGELILNVTVGSEHVHDYHVSWEWADDYSSADAVFICSGDESHTFTLKAEVTEEILEEANCGWDGEARYTAAVVYEGITYTDIQTAVIPATEEHEYTEPEYIWSEDNEFVQAKVSCTVCGMRMTTGAWTTYDVEKEPGCEEEGLGVYTALFNKEPFENVRKEVVLDAIGHAYSLSTWNWAEDYSSAEAVFICEHDSSHIHNETASIVSEIVEPTCGVDGSGKYRASVTFEGNEYTDEKTAVIPATGNHEITSAEYTWSHDNKTVTAKAVCEECGNEVTETAETSYEVIKEATMDEEGTGRYTAVFENEFFETQTKDVVIPKLSDTLPQSITLNIHETSILFDTSISLHATVGPDTALDKSVSWSSSDESVAIVGANGTVRGIKPGKATITATTVNGLTDTCEIRVLFTDVADSTRYYFNPVYWAFDRNITVGYGGADLFSPDYPVTRGQFVTFLYRLAGEPEVTEDSGFDDVDSEKFYAKSIAWAAANGITTGYAGRNEFGPDDKCTREQIVTFLWRYAESPKPEKTVSFTDSRADAYYLDALSWAAEKEITVGLNDGTGRFGVGMNCTRGMTVTFLYRFNQNR